jgi:hypothetical protein
MKTYTKSELFKSVDAYFAEKELNVEGRDLSELVLIRKLSGELSELSKELHHFEERKCAAPDVLTEVVDVYIMIERWLEFYQYQADFDKEYKFKLGRLYDNLHKGTL